jgi:hypothetical protein
VPFSTTGLDQMLDALNGGSPTSVIAYASLHTAYSATGTSEVTGGSPAYARQAVTWSAAAAGSKASASIAAAFNVPASTTVAFVGLWSAVSSGTFGGMGPAGAGTQYAFTCTSASPGVFTAPGSSYSNTQTVVVFNGAGATIPAAFTAGTVYYVVSAAGATFSLSATSGGSAINTAGTGAGIVQAVTLESFAGQGSYTVSSETLSVT